MEEEASGPQRGLQNGALAQMVLSRPGGEGCWDAPHCRLGPGSGGFPLGPKPSPRNHQRQLLRVGGHVWDRSGGEMHSASSSL